MKFDLDSIWWNIIIYSTAIIVCFHVAFEFLGIDTSIMWELLGIDTSIMGE
tara:strand:+ start:219 stop:371 length:153 start_codon:yes stop_codon:yes gene_type:complete